MRSKHHELPRKSRNILTSGGLEPVADGGKDGHSIFAYHFLKILGENPHPYISVKQLGAEVEKMVTRNSGQTPIGRFIHGAGDEGGQFFFINRQSRKRRIEPEIVPAPSDVDISFDDIREAETRQREIREKWKKWQERRGGQFQEAKKYEKSEYLNAGQKKAVWERFHAAVTEDNQFSKKDDEMRSYARDRISYWEKREKKAITGNMKGDDGGISGAAETKSNEKGRNGRFVAYDDGTVKDTETGLMWAVKDNGEDINWKEAKKYSENYRVGGYTDWRLPTLNELASIYDSKNGYTMDCNKKKKIYTNKLIHVSCWTVWPSETRDSEAACFRFRKGNRGWEPLSATLNIRVLPVRGGDISGATETKPNETGRDGHFVAYDDETVKDTKTGLMWAAKDNGENIDWKDAKQYCENYKGGEYTDWRLPTVDELRSIYDPKNGHQMDCDKKLKVYTNKLIHISCGWVWALETRGSEAAYFYFAGNRHWIPQSNSSNTRVLPVRGGK